MKNIHRLVLPVLAILAMALQPAAAGSSEFIENMPPLAQDPDRAGAMIWEKPGVDRAAYTKVMIEPITIFISPDSEYKGLNADDMKTLADEFQTLTNVKLAKKKRGLLSFTPIGLVVHAAESAAGANISLKDAELEIEMLDSVSGERLGVLIDKAPVTTGNEKLSWDSIKKTFAYYAERFKLRMQAPK
jgi:hypothetical protein